MPIAPPLARGGAVGGESGALADFVTRQAALALERAERRVRGLRYKVPRFVHEDILARPAFRAGITRLAHELGRPQAAILRDAQRYLKEIAATHSPYVIDLTAQLIHLLYTRAYGEALHYDRGDLEDIYTIAQRYPVVFLPSHKSNLDHLVLQYALHENGHPPNHTAGGINMNFFPVGPLVRRSGVFFIRRTFKDNLVYKFVLQHYIDYLIESARSSGTSRAAPCSGKPLLPRFGMLAYVVDAYRRGRSEDVHLIPVAVAYEQIHEVREYAEEQRGASKQRESFSWFLRVVRGLQRRLGDIHINFGEPISLADALGPPNPAAEPNPDEQSLEVQKLAFEVAVRINRVTPITPISLVTHALLGVGDRPLTEIGRSLPIVRYVRVRGLPPPATSTSTRPRASSGRSISWWRAASSPASTRAGGRHLVGPDQHLAAALSQHDHPLRHRAIAEVAAARRRDDVTDRRTAFSDAALALRDLLKFEFFFSERDGSATSWPPVALHDPSGSSASTKARTPCRRSCAACAIQRAPRDPAVRRRLPGRGRRARQLGPRQAIRQDAFFGRCGARPAVSSCSAAFRWSSKASLRAAPRLARPAPRRSRPLRPLPRHATPQGLRRQIRATSSASMRSACSQRPAWGCSIR